MDFFQDLSINDFFVYTFNKIKPNNQKSITDIYEIQIFKINMQISLLVHTVNCFSVV